ncbi:hypothetical protein LCGC14_3106840 [marine sediment metagenome]|uniref:Uncharacterized protein n=1 Tax=marine sediment metagenome TaxID=412755 RepID=A0A0F8WV08_9ZZZZ
MNRRELAKTGFLGLCAALLGKKVAEPVKSLTASTEGGSRSMDKIYIYREYPAGSTEPIPPGWDFLNEPGEDVYNG